MISINEISSYNELKKPGKRNISLMENKLNPLINIKIVISLKSGYTNKIVFNISLKGKILNNFQKNNLNILNYSVTSTLPQQNKNPAEKAGSTHYPGKFILPLLQNLLQSPGPFQNQSLPYNFPILLHPLYGFDADQFHILFVHVQPWLSELR